MDNSSELHHEYYSQFVTDSTIAFVAQNIGLKRLRASTDPHLNDVVRMKRNGWVWDYTPINTHLAKELGEGDSLSTRTCVGKAAARIMLRGMEK
jgi:hypothetical protein